ncbi:MAG: hypothetical protein HYX87_09435 [Chloroflexi bacterium]|nr:hypothetical protein [Chloroflexota bacterium]
MYNTILTEERNKPAAAVVNQDFAVEARSAAATRGMPGLRILAAMAPLDCVYEEQIEKGIPIEAVIAALTRPLNAEEKSPESKATEKPSRVAFEGNIVEVNRFFYQQGWTDGLPVMPPTEDAVREMLTGTGLPPDHVVGKLPTRQGKATVEKIAINAVMAGALPTYMPILIAGVEALLEPKSSFSAFQVSTGSWSPFWIINGPVRIDLNINSSSGALSPGDMANAAIGRAMQLIIKNIGGARKGIEDMGTLGNPGKYTMVIAENEEKNPWEPLHMEQGFDREDSTVTVYFPNCFSQLVLYNTDEKGILSTLIHNLLPVRIGLLGLLLPPAHAKTLADKGWTKRRLSEFISEYARVPAYHHPRYWRAFEGLPVEIPQPLSPMDSVPIIPDPGWIRIIVVGGVGSLLGVAAGGNIGGADWVTRKAILPTGWRQLVEKYKGVVPRSTA